jgi:hypothetical protein
MLLARLGENVGVDLWTYETADGRGIRKALDFLVPFALGQKWTYQQLGEWPPQQLFRSCGAQDQCTRMRHFNQC